jgi:peptide/nickel transport system substrate-binding protein
MRMDADTSQKPLGAREAFIAVRHGRFALLNDLLRRFSPSERLALYVFSILLAGSALILLAVTNNALSVQVPSRGGTLVEGVVGPARFINPVLHTSQADGDLTQLVYSGLTRSMPDDSIIPDLAKSYEISEDGTVYTFHLREDATFHDGAPVTAADVLYTVRAAQNPAIKSPHRADWEGVAIASPDTYTVIFTLPNAYAPFLQNTTLGILPEHLWKNTTPEDFPFNPLNTHPVGSGQFRVDNVETDSTGAAYRYDLVPFKSHVLGRPFLKRISIVLYQSEDALIGAFKEHDINALAGISPQKIEGLISDEHRMLTATLPRVFGVFLNQNRAQVFADASVRAALDAALDKDRLVQMVLSGYGTPLTGPIPPGIIDEGEAAVMPATEMVSTAYTQETIDEARAILSRNGWVFDEGAGSWKKGSSELSFSLATADTPELTATADAVATAWRQAGIKVSLQVYALSELNTAVLRPRAYDAVLFGEVVGRELDLFAFWHSSQRNDPGLNLSLYANTKADTLLSQARATTDKTQRNELYGEFAEVVEEDRPAIFLYAPAFLYVVPRGLEGIGLATLTTPSERFLNAHEWYTDVEHVWEIF